MVPQKLRILLVDDDEDDYVIVRDLLTSAQGRGFTLQWVPGFDAAAAEMLRARHDAYIIDYRLGFRSGIELIREVHALGFDGAVIVLTGQGDYQVDVEAMQAGAADYLVKGRITPQLLERSIRYAIERKQVERQLRGYQNRLEELVLERTGQLEAANQRLESVNEALRVENEERRRADEARQESEERYGRLVRHAMDVIYIVDAEGRITSVNPAFEALTGWSRDDWLGRQFGPILHPDDVEKVWDRFSQLKQGQELDPIELRVLSKAGEYLTFEFRTTPLKRHGKFIGVQGVARDISDRKEAEEKITRQNEFLNHVLESLTHPFYVLDAKTFEVKMANSAARNTGMPDATTCHKLTHGRDMPCNGLEHACPVTMILQTGKPVTVEHIHRGADGEPINVEVHAYPIFDENGNVTEVIEYSFDVTLRRKMEQAVRESAEKIKRFAYSISHDIKSPIIGINGLTRLLIKQYRDRLDERGVLYCEQILKASEQVANLVEEINLYIRNRERQLEFVEFDLREIFSSIRDEFAPTLKLRGVRLLMPEAPQHMRADQMAIQRVLRNLVDNSLKYGGPELSEIVVQVTSDQDQYHLMVSDNGVGIKEEHCETIFELFERNETSRGIEGTGLGLAIVRELAAKHRGAVCASPNPDKGVTFTFSISRTL